MNILEKIQNLFIPDNRGLSQRRYDLDWLRVLAFGLLIFYHTGMLYVANWGFHVKSQYLSESLESVMLLINPWRMPILWIISGIAIRFILAKVPLIRFIVQRSYRLLFPLLFAILVIIPLQLYYEMTQAGDLNMSYWEFYNHFFDLDNPIFENYQPGIWPHVDVNHLWYLRELWSFSLYLIFLLPAFNSDRFNKGIDWLVKINGYFLILIISIPIFIIQMNVEDNRNIIGFTFLVYGYVVGWHRIIWQRLKENSTRLFIVGLVNYIALVIFYNTVWIVKTDETNQLLLSFGMAVYSLDIIVWVLAMLGLAHRFLNYSSRKLGYFNEAVYPYYILHQTIIIVVGFEISQFKLGAIIEPAIVLVVTFSICALGYEVIRRIDWLRPFFGLKIQKKYPEFMVVVYKLIVTILILGFALEILF